MSFQPEPVSRLRQQIESQIRDAIVARTLLEGDKLPSEAELARQFGVARSTVREALRSLASFGLISQVPGATGGSFVRRVDASTVGRVVSDAVQLLVDLGNTTKDEVISAREILELPATRLAAENRTEEDVQRLYALVDEQEILEVDDPLVPELDAAFHAEVARASGNRVLAALLYALHMGSRPGGFIKLTRDNRTTTIAHHLDLVKAIEAKDPDTAVSLITAHLDYIHGLYRDSDSD
jgi:GntR family transcriptional regulator, transcriptional repressor for pyruvate dehydrogenase complex